MYVLEKNTVVKIPAWVTRISPLRSNTDYRSIYAFRLTSFCRTNFLRSKKLKIVTDVIMQLKSKITLKIQNAVLYVYLGGAPDAGCN